MVTTDACNRCESCRCCIADVDKTYQRHQTPICSWTEVFRGLRRLVTLGCQWIKLEKGVWYLSSNKNATTKPPSAPLRDLSVCKLLHMVYFRSLKNCLRFSNASLVPSPSEAWSETVLAKRNEFRLQVRLGMGTHFQEQVGVW